MRLLFHLSGLLICSVLHAQEIAPSIISSAGNHVQNEGLYLQWTLGEIIVEDSQNDNFQISEGFHYAHKPDLVSGITSDSIQIQRGESFPYHYSIGNVSSPDVKLSFRIDLYLSLDSTISFDDLLIESEDQSGLAYQDSVDSDGSFTVPLEIDTGEYFLICAADPSDEVLELSELNNISVIPILIYDCPDLALESIQISTDSVAANGSVLVTTDLSNLGTIAIEPTSTGLFISSDPVLDIQDQFLTQFSIPALGAKASFSRSETIDLSHFTLSIGPQFLIALADYQDLAMECNEGNNNSFIPIVISIPRKPDLTLDSLRVEQTCILPGDIIDINYQLSNIGKATSGPSESHFFISPNDTFDSNAQLLMVMNEAGTIAAGTSRTISKTLTIPHGMAPGVYFLIGCADFPNQIMEEEERNNCTSHFITIRNDIRDCKPDITIYGTDVPGKLPSSSTFSVKYTIRNLNPVGTNQSSRIRFLLSSDSQPDINDIELHSKWVPSIAGSTSIADQQNLTLPSSITAGNYFILICYDPEDLVMEGSEQNNWGASSITVLGQGLADLSISDLDIPDPCLYYNSSFGVCYTVYNNGFSPSEYSTINYYLSIDPVLSAEDSLIYTHDLPVIPICDYIVLKEIIYLSLKIPGGTYYLIVDLDPFDLVIEDDESNNRAFVSKEFKIADLHLTKDLPDVVEVCAGEMDSIPIILRNTGNLDAGSFYVGAYLSSDDQCDTSDVLISYTLLDQLNASQETSISLTFEVPDQPGEEYYLVFKANFLESIPEGNRINNECAQRIRLVNKRKQQIDLTEFYFYQKNIGKLDPTNDLRN